MKNFIIALYILIYFAGCSIFSNEVKNACTHGNCKHGFYSKYTKNEQAAYYLWEWGGIIIGYFLFANTDETSKNRYSRRNCNKQVQVQVTSTALKKRNETTLSPPQRQEESRLKNVIAQKLQDNTLTYEQLRQIEQLIASSDKWKSAFNSNEIQLLELRLQESTNRKNFQKIQSNTLTYEQLKAISGNKFDFGFNFEEIQLLELRLKEAISKREEYTNDKVFTDNQANETNSQTVQNLYPPLKNQEENLEDRKMLLVEKLIDNTLTYEQLRAIADNQWKFGFNLEETNLLKLRLIEATPKWTRL